MNVSVITMDQEEALVKLEAYRAQLRRRADDEYEQAVAGYKAMAEGKPILNLTVAFTETGLGADNRPKLAIARADMKEVEVTSGWRRGTRELVFDARTSSRQQPTNGRVVRLPMPYEHVDIKRGFALVPMVPADVRPNRNLSNYFTLWEVIEWADRSRLMRPDRDPYLLQPIVGDLYAVIAEWDLTDLERSIMGARVPR